MFNYFTKDYKLRIGKVVSHIIIGLVIILTLFQSLTIVPTGHTGVVTRFGAVSDTTLQEGLHFKVPFIDKVIKIDNRVVRVDVEGESASKDLQTINVTVSINYRVNKNDSANIYRNVRKDYEDIIVKPAVQESIKAITAKYDAEELITKRQEVSSQMKATLGEKIEKYGLLIENFNVVNFGFSEEFNKAIEAKQTAQQLALKAEQDLIRIKKEAEQEIVKAQAEAEAMKIKKEQISDEMIQMEWIKKWDGKLPQYVGDGINFYMPIK